MQSFTVLGGSGFIGSNLVRVLESRSKPYWAPHRSENILGRSLGHVMYCIGVTADFRKRPFDTVRAHVSHLLSILEEAKFESLLYLSTTRVYRGLKTSQENVTLHASPMQTDDLYNISKIMGESMCLSSKRRDVRIARLANVYGRDFSSDNFLSSVIRDAVENRRVVLRTSLDSEKDYVSIDDVIDALLKIATSGKFPIYNVASGVNVSNRELMDEISSLTGCQVEVAPSAEIIKFPRISIERMKAEFDFAPSSVLQDLHGVVELYEQHREPR